MRKLPGTIVLIDNEKYELHLLQLALSRIQWETDIRHFLYCEDALDYLRKTKEKIFLIISDLNMPGMNGLEFKKEIDQDNRLSKKAIPFIFSSNSATVEEVTEAYDYRVQGYFKKPLELDQQVEMLDIIIKYWIASRHPYEEERTYTRVDNKISKF